MQLANTADTKTLYEWEAYDNYYRQYARSSNHPQWIRRLDSSTIIHYFVRTNQIGKDPNALDTAAMHKLKHDQSFKGLDIRSITPAQMGLVSKNLFALGLIDVITANLLVNAGNDLDNYGNHKAPDAPMNALDYFASRITHLQNASSQGDKYASFVIPDYRKNTHVLQNLDDFAKLAQKSLSAIT